MKLIYICSPYSGDILNNTAKAIQYCKEAIQDGIPIAPHLLYPQFLNDNIAAERIIGMRCAINLLMRCDVMYVYGETISKGMAAEISTATDHNIPIVYKPSLPKISSARYFSNLNTKEHKTLEEQLIEIYRNALATISEHCVDISKKHIDDKYFVDGVRECLREARYAADRLIGDV